MKKFEKRLPCLCAAFVIGLVFVFASCSNATDSPAVPIVNQTAPGGNPAGTGTGGGGQSDTNGGQPNNGQPGSGGATTYKVELGSIENGSVARDKESAAAGDEVTLTATANQGYVWSSYTVKDASGAAVAVSAQGKFTMPASDVTVSATFVVGASATLSNFASTVQALTQDSTIAMTGQLTSGDLATIKSALRALDPSQPKIKLDLRGVTGLESLPQHALEGCEKLQSLSLPEGLTSIGDNAFIGCENLESLYLPASYSFFDAVELAFDAGQKFSSINVAEGNSKYSSVDGVLFSKDKKTLIKCPVGKSGAYTVPAGVTTIGPNAFSDCRKLTGIVLPEGLQEIDRRAFQSTTISSMTIPSSVITIYDGVFSGNTSLTSLTFNDATDWYSTNNEQALQTRSGGTSASLGDATANATAFKSYNDYYYKAVAPSQNVAAFVQKVAALTGDSTVKLEGQIKQTDLAAIYKAINEASYKIKLDMSGATGLYSLPEQAFECCVKLQEVILPQGITSIGNCVFGGCSDLESVSLPASVTSIGRDAFDSSNLSSINVAQGNAVYSSVDGVLFSKDKKTLIFYPKGKSGSFAIPSGVKVIGKSAFAWCSNLTGVTIPDGVEKIEERAFDNSNIASAELPDSVTEIGDYAFNNCQSLTCVKLSSKLAKIGDYAFYSIKVESLELPNSVTSIGRQAFQSCGSLESLVIPASVTRIGNEVFTGCTSLTSVEFKAPSGWKRTADSNYWGWRTNGESVNESDLSTPTQNAAKLKLIGSDNDKWGSFYWYK